MLRVGASQEWDALISGGSLASSSIDARQEASRAQLGSTSGNLDRRKHEHPLHRHDPRPSRIPRVPPSYPRLGTLVVLYMARSHLLQPWGATDLRCVFSSGPSCHGDHDSRFAEVGGREQTERNQGTPQAGFDQALRTASSAGVVLACVSHPRFPPGSPPPSRALAQSASRPTSSHGLHIAASPVILCAPACHCQITLPSTPRSAPRPGPPPWPTRILRFPCRELRCAP